MEMSVDLTVKDVRTSTEFYRRVGLDVPPVWEADGVAHHVEVEQGLMLNSRELTRGYDPSWPDASGVMLIFHAEDRESVDAKFADLTSDGNHVGLMSPVDQERKQAPTLSPA